MLEDRPRHGSEAVVVAGPVSLRPQLLFLAERHLDIEENLLSRRRVAVFAVHVESRRVWNIMGTYNLPPCAGQACGRAGRPDMRRYPIVSSAARARSARVTGLPLL